MEFKKGMNRSLIRPDKIYLLGFGMQYIQVIIKAFKLKSQRKAVTRASVDTLKANLHGSSSVLWATLEKCQKIHLPLSSSFVIQILEP